MRVRAQLLVVPFALLAACHAHEDHGESLPIFFETEGNDDPQSANDFGVLRPGDRFIIQGTIRDDVLDPFDGFAFTAAVPLHVDFQLFSGSPAADLDVCLYDPQLDQIVSCFATTNDPEQGGVDVFSGGLAFQLVVESFVGDASYSLEIDVQPLFASTMASAPAHSAARLAGVGARVEHAVEATGGYHKTVAARPALEIEQYFELDEERGLLLERVHVTRDERR